MRIWVWPSRRKSRRRAICSAEVMNKSRRPKNNRDQNRQVRDAARQVGLTGEQTRQLGEDVERESRHYGADLDFHDLLEIAREIKNEA